MIVVGVILYVLTIIALVGVFWTGARGESR